MDSTYGGVPDVDMNRMFDQYLFKGSENFDLSLAIPDGENHHQYNMQGEQVGTFHTPNFGDDEFEIPQIGDGSGNPNMVQQQQQQQQFQNMQHVQMGGSQPLSHPNEDMMMRQQHYQQNMYMPHAEHINQNSQSFDTQTTYTMTALRPPMNNMMQQQHNQQMMTGGMPQNNPNMMGSMNRQMGMQQYHMPQQHQQMHPPGHLNGSPNGTGSNHTSPGQETSEDSDDSTPLAQVLSGVGGVKRPSPEPSEKPTFTKKPKMPKKKKKRDPNEPQKPVSAYALFFRDTQAAIKGQNPNASFGEVSKIVASMWDSLDAESKNIYKKKTEAAKKEYLKALAAYRASLVSKSATDQVDGLYSTPNYTAFSSSNQSSIMSSTVTSSTPLSHLSSPPVNTSNQQHHGQMSQLQKKAPLLTSLMENSGSGSLPPASTLNNSSAANQQSVMMLSMASMGMQVQGNSAPQQQHQMQGSQNLHNSIQPPQYSQQMMNQQQMMSPPHNQQMHLVAQQPITQMQQNSPPNQTVQLQQMGQASPQSMTPSPPLNSNYSQSNMMTQGRFHGMGGLPTNIQFIRIGQVDLRT